MKKYRVSASGRVEAPPAVVYSVIADYKRHHPQIVPPKYFGRLDVLEGGVGAGTRTRVEMHVLGQRQVFEQVVTEPEPGRVVMEENTDGSALTTFTVDAVGERAAHVTIATEFPLKPGIPGMLERMAASLLFPRIYAEELAQLAKYAGSLPVETTVGQGR